MSEIVNSLVEMGFSVEKAELAISRTGTKELQTAIDWILSHEDDVDVNTPTEQIPTVSDESNQVSNPIPASNEEPVPVAKSMKCEDCGKLFQSQDEASFHASKSGHVNFSESTEEKKPLSEDEKKEQLAQIEAKLKQRRLDREAREKQEDLDREKARIKSGKEMIEAKKKYEEQEMKKIVDQRKREKEEEKQARQRVKEQIEQDRLARKAKFSGVEATNNPVIQPVVQSPPTKLAAPKTYDEVKLQIKLPDGTSLIQSFGAKEPLSAVRLYVELNGKNGDGSFSLRTNFPKKIFSSEDYDKPLENLGLAPSAVLIVSKIL